MSRFVQFSRFGESDALEIVDVDPPEVGVGQVRVRVMAAGLNPVDYYILRGGETAAAYGATLPSGMGNDFSGVVDLVGSGAEGFEVDDEVFGGMRLWAEADYLVIGADKLIRKPEGLTFEQAGGLDIAGRTAWASVKSLALTPADTVLVSAAAGGVGGLAAQLARTLGATVIGSASISNHEYLRSIGVIPVEYGDRLVENVRAVAPQGVTAVLDNFGPDTIDAGFALGVPGSRINTIAARGYRADEGVAGVGGSEAHTGELAKLANLIAKGEIDLPIDSVYPLERVAEAYDRLMTRHARGKIVLVTE